MFYTINVQDLYLSDSAFLTSHHYLSWCQYTTLFSLCFSSFKTKYVFYHTVFSSFPFTLRHRHGDTAPIIHTLLLLVCVLVHEECLPLFKQPIIYSLRWSPLRGGARSLDPVSRGRLCPVSIWSSLHRFMEEREGFPGYLNRSGPIPHISLPSNPPPAQKGRARVYTRVLCLLPCACALVCLCVRAFKSWKKADTMDPGSRLKGFISHCVSQCLGDGRKLFMGLKMLERYIFFPIQLCVCSSRKLWWLLIFSPHCQ